HAAGRHRHLRRGLGIVRDGPVSGNGDRAARGAGGLGAALIFPVSVSVLTNAFSAARAGHAIGLAYGIAGLGNAAGPLVGGLLTQTLGWRAIFWMLVPLALVALVIGVLTVP